MEISQIPSDKIEPKNQPGIHSCRLKKISSITEDTIEAWFDIDGDFSFIPGQYVQIKNEMLSDDVEKGSSRNFSITSTPDQKTKSFSIAFRKSNSPFKTALIEAKIGDSFVIKGPLGVFTLPPQIDRPITLLASGIGVTPFVSMIRYVTEARINTSIHLIYSDASDKKFAYLSELEEIAKENSNITLTKHVGDILIEDLKHYSMLNYDTIWYLCGPPKFVIDFTELLPEKLYTRQEDIRTEEYVGYDPNNASYKTPSLISKSDTVFSEKNLHSSKTLDALLHAIGQTSLVSVTNNQGTILYVNPRFLEISKYSREELMGQNHRILKSGYHPPSYFQKLWSTISKGKTWRGDIKNRAKDGSIYWVDSTITPICNENEKPVFFLAVRVLISDRKALEESANILKNLELLKLERNKYSSLLTKFNLAIQSAKIGVWSLNLFDNRFSWNDRMYDLYEAKKNGEDSIFDLWQARFYQDDKKIWDTAFKKAIQNKTSFDAEFRILLPNDSLRHLKACGNIEYEKDGTPKLITGVCWDETTEKEVDEMKTDFIYLVSHQLKSPLASMKNLLELLALTELGKLNSQQVELITSLREANSHMIKLVNFLISIAKLESGSLNTNIEKIELNSLLNKIITTSKKTYPNKNIKFEIEIEENSTQIDTDPKLLEEVYFNLVSNAVKYSSPESTVSIHLCKRGDNIVFQVKDSGMGIPEKEQGSIFNKFYRGSNAVKTKEEGSGLGMYTAKLIAKKLGGDLWFQSEEGKGSTFWVSIPQTK